jgi:hypothetical protein
MNQEEAEKILKILTYADGGCAYCARSLFKDFCNEFSEFKNLAIDMFKKEFENDLFKEE